MLKHAVVRYFLPGILVGALAGYAVASWSAPDSSKAEKRSLRQKFLSSDDDFDYEKIARICLRANEQGARPITSAMSARTPTEDVDPAEVEKLKQRLDEVMSVTLQNGVWTRPAAIRAQSLIRRLPTSDAAEFEQLLQTAIDRGDLQAAAGAWIPKRLN